MRTNSICVFTVALFLCMPVASRSAELRVETVKAWNEYIRVVDGQAAARVNGQKHFLWLDDLPGGPERARGGEVVVAPVRGSGSHPVAHGLIHDWIGTMFVPDANIGQVFSVVRDYNRYKEFFAPVVIESKLVKQTNEEQSFSMLWQQKIAFVTAAMASDYQSKYVQLDDRRWYNVAYSTRVQQVENYGGANEKRLAPDQGSGYIWRLYSIARYEHRDGGVYVEMEAIGLSRDIPFSVRWLVNPIVSQLPRNSVIASLEQTRHAVRTVVVANSRPGKILNDPTTVARVTPAGEDEAIK